jgi:nucleotide-binding universal stress UspA family protein
MKEATMNDFKWKRILAPTDRSPFADKAVSYAHDLAKASKAELHVLRVMDDTDRAASEYAVTGVIEPGAAPTDYARWIAQLLGEAGDIRRIESVRISSDVPDAILRYAQRNGIDLIVMATHGRTGLTHLLMGSVAEKVMRSAPCPVLTLRPETRV